jgi:2-amino-4-hydroxy-6-hydroxymethyldihydropteridine diphosphokinase
MAREYHTSQDGRSVRRVLIAVGANMSGRWGSPRQSIARALRELSRIGARIVRVSHFYLTAPIGPGRQARYLNGVLLADTHLAPAALLRAAKRIEREAGRRLGAHWGPRPLDIDILDYAGCKLGWPSRSRQRGRLVLPHPELHKRAFVLVPLLDVVPAWCHPVLGTSARSLLARLSPKSRASVGQPLDPKALLCDKACE